MGRFGNLCFGLPFFAIFVSCPTRKCKHSQRLNCDILLHVLTFFAKSNKSVLIKVELGNMKTIRNCIFENILNGMLLAELQDFTQVY